MTRPIPRLYPPADELPRRGEYHRADTEPSAPPVAIPGTRHGAPAPKMPRATDPPHLRGGGDSHRTQGSGTHTPPKLPFARQEIVNATDDDRAESPRTRRPSSPPPQQRLAKLPAIRPDTVTEVDDRAPAPSKAPRATTELAGPPGHVPSPTPTPALASKPAPAHVPTPTPTPAVASKSVPAHLPAPTPTPPSPALTLDALPPRTESAQLPAVDLELASSRARPRGTPNLKLPPGEQIRTLVYAPEPTRAAWIDRELSHPPITIQVARRARGIVTALTRDPPPRPGVLIIDFDAIPAADIAELHALRRDGWFGRLIGLGRVPSELRASLGVDHVFEEPLVRDSLLDCVAGTRHAAVTTACPVIPPWDDHS